MLLLKTQTRIQYGSQPVGAVLNPLFRLGVLWILRALRGHRLGLRAVEWMVQALRYQRMDTRAIAFPSLRCGATTRLAELLPRPLRLWIRRRVYQLTRRIL